MSTYLINYRVGDIVDIKANAAQQKGMPHKYYHGYVVVGTEKIIETQTKIYSGGVTDGPVLCTTLQQTPLVSSSTKLSEIGISRNV
jgi:ribosomal protein L21E